MGSVGGGRPGQRVAMRGAMWRGFMIAGQSILEVQMLMMNVVNETEQIEREIGIKIECELTDDEEKMKFTDKTQDELIELLIRAQVSLSPPHFTLHHSFIAVELPVVDPGETDDRE